MQSLGAVWDNRANRWQVPDARVPEARQIIAWHEEYAAAHPNDPEAHEVPRRGRHSNPTKVGWGWWALGAAAAAAAAWALTRNRTPTTTGQPDRAAWSPTTDLLVMIDEVAPQETIDKVEMLAAGLRELNVDEIAPERSKRKVVFVNEQSAMGDVLSLLEKGATVLLVTTKPLDLPELSKEIPKNQIIVLPTVPVDAAPFVAARAAGARIVGVKPNVATLSTGWADDIFRVIAGTSGIPADRRL
jgi:hypothetical protein